MDPLVDSYAHITPYSFANNNPIRFTNFLGFGPKDEVSESNSYTYKCNSSNSHTITHKRNITQIEYSNKGNTKKVTTMTTTTSTKVEVTEKIDEKGNEIIEYKETTKQTVEVSTYTVEKSYDFGLLTGPTPAWNIKDGSDKQLFNETTSLDGNELNTVDSKLAGYVNGLERFISDARSSTANLYNQPLQGEDAFGYISLGTLAFRKNHLIKFINPYANIASSAFFVASKLRGEIISGIGHSCELEHDFNITKK